MAEKKKHLAPGFIIVLIGFLLLLNNLHVVDMNRQLTWGIALLILGLIFIFLFVQNKSLRASLVLGIILTIFGAIIIFDSFNYFSDDLLGMFFLWGIAALFISIFVRNDRQWWTIIPGGLFFIFGVLVLLNLLNIFNDDLLGFIFLAGFSLIFWFLYLIRNEENKLHWARYPAFIIAIFALLVLSSSWPNQFTKMLLPIAIIFFGAHLLISNLQQKKNVTETLKDTE